MTEEQIRRIVREEIEEILSEAEATGRGRTGFLQSLTRARAFRGLGRSRTADHAEELKSAWSAVRRTMPPKF